MDLLILGVQAKGMIVLALAGLSKYLQDSLITFLQFPPVDSWPLDETSRPKTHKAANT